MVTELTDPLNIGFRTVGSREHALGDAWAVQQVQDLAELCDHVKARAAKDGRTVDLECDWDWQQGSGTHKFDIMNQVIYKSYQNLTNILFRISNSRPESKSLALLVNSHLDSSLPTPGAADDALSVAISLEAARVLIESVGRGEWEAGWSLIILINNAEETFQDASHLFSTQHPWAQTVRTVMNLEAAGSKGPELLFQATSEEMVWVYQGVPYPYGTVLANDIFSSGVLMSDTDFRQFDQYLLTPGIDMAVVGHSYFYHSTRDVVENIEPGVAQHFAENVLSMIKQMTFRPKKSTGEYEEDSLMQRIRKFDETPAMLYQPTSPDSSKSTSSTPPAIPSSTTSTSPFSSADKGGQQHSRRPDLVFFTLFGSKPFVYSGFTAKIVYTFWAMICTWMTVISVKKSNHKATEGVEPKGSASPIKTSRSNVSLVLASVASILISLFRSVLYANAVAFIMRKVLSKQLSWFAGEWRPVALYASPVLLALISPPFGTLIPRSVPNAMSERSLVHGALLLNAFLAVIVQSTGIGSAVLPMLLSVGIGSGVAVGLLLEWQSGENEKEEGTIHPVVYVVGSILPLAVGVELAVGTLDVFVPLTGRMPPFVPAEHIIATLVAVFVFLSLPLLPALVYRLPFSSQHSGSSSIATRANLRNVLRLACALSVVWFAFVSGWGSWPFDPAHPKRIFVSLSESLPSGEYGVHIAGMDGAAGFPPLVQGLAQVVGTFNQQNTENMDIRAAEKTAFDQWNSNWGPFYPLGVLLDHYSLVTLPNLTPGSETWREEQSFGVVVIEDSTDEAAGTRSLKLEMRHKDVIWTMLEFDARIISWSIDDNPPAGYTRHHIKEASYYGTDIWTLDVTIDLNPDIHESMRRPNTSLTLSNGSSERPGALRLTFSGMVEKEMWPGKKWQWEAEKEMRARQGTPEPENTVMEFFERISGWMEQEKGGSTDLFMMHSIVKDTVI
ncbi:hypothetical protein FRC20_010042 [Serendipita sp. 405]|nr:hypothetical protein FRC20_010042 [Serendipita sp. 405]